MDEDLAFATIGDLGKAIRARTISPVELTTSMIERIEHHDPKLNSYITVTADQALDQAKCAETALMAGGDLGPLHGIPFAAKDLFATEGISTTGGSLLFKNWRPDHDATVIRRLKEAGAVMLGKTNLHELAYGTTSANPHFGAVHNPWKRGYHPGGSSGGSAAAVAAGLATMALGTDTGASIRQPAACCGIVGLKPTYGRVSKHGVLPLAWSMDHAGPLTRGVADAGLVLGVIAGHDDGDPGSVRCAPPDVAGDLRLDLKGHRLGIVRDFFMEGGDREVFDAIEAIVPVFEGLGASVAEMALPDIDKAFAAGTLNIAVEGAAYHADNLMRHPTKFSPQCKADLELGHFYKATDYLQAQRLRRQLIATTAKAMAPFDALLMPTAAITATSIEGNPANHPVYRVRNTVPFNFLGLPAISLPAGFSSQGLPIGLQIVGKAFDEAHIINIAHAYEQATDWHRQRPKLTT